jgi:hypothetical protein
MPVDLRVRNFHSAKDILGEARLVYRQLRAEEITTDVARTLTAILRLCLECSDRIVQMEHLEVLKQQVAELQAVNGIKKVA